MTPPNSLSRLTPSSVSVSIDQASFSNPDSNGSLSVTMDALVGGFQEQATDGRTFVAVTAAGMAYRAGTLGTMSLGMFRGIPLLSRSLPVAVGLGSEVTAFEMTNRSLAHITGDSSNPNLWRWNGQGGLRQGLLSSFITFGTLRGAGHLAWSENFVVQHLLQDSAMVLGHNISGALGITPDPTGSLAEQYLHAEAMNLQMGAGMALGHGLAPGLHALESSLDLFLQFRETSLPSHARLRRNRQGSFRERLGPLFASAAGLATFLIPEIARASVESSAAGSHFSPLLAGLGLAGAGILAMAMGGGRSPDGSGRDGNNNREEVFQDLERRFTQWERVLKSVPDSEKGPHLLEHLRNEIFQRLFVSHDPDILERIPRLLSGMEISLRFQPSFLVDQGLKHLDPYSILSDSDLVDAMRRGLLQETDYEDLKFWLNNPPRLLDEPLFQEIAPYLRAEPGFPPEIPRRPDTRPDLSSARKAQLALIAQRLSMEKMICLFETLHELASLPPETEPTRIHELLRERGLEHMFFQGERRDSTGRPLSDSREVYLISPLEFPWTFDRDRGRYLAYSTSAAQGRNSWEEATLMRAFRSYEDYLLKRPCFQVSFELPVQFVSPISYQLAESLHGSDATPRMFQLTSLEGLISTRSENEGESARSLATQFRWDHFQIIDHFMEFAESEDVTPAESLAFLRGVRLLYDEVQEGRPLEDFPEPFEGRQVTPLLRKAISDTEILTELQYFCEYSSVLRNFLEGHRDYSDFKELAGYDFRVLEFLTSMVVFFPSASDSTVEILRQVDLEQLWNRIRTENQLDFFDIAFTLAHDLGLESGLNFLRNFNPPPMVWARVLHLWDSRVKFLTEIGNPHAAPMLEILRNDPPFSDSNEMNLWPLLLGFGLHDFFSPGIAHASTGMLSGSGSMMETALALTFLGLGLFGMVYRRPEGDSPELRQLIATVRERWAAWENGTDSERERVERKLFASIQAVPELHRIPLVNELRDSLLNERSDGPPPQDVPDGITEPVSLSSAKISSSLPFLRRLIRQLPQETAEKSYASIRDRLLPGDREVWVGLWAMEEIPNESPLAIPSDRRGLLIRSLDFLRSRSFQLTLEFRLYFELISARIVEALGGRSFDETFPPPRFTIFNEPLGRVRALFLLHGPDPELRLKAIREVLTHSYLPPDEIEEMVMAMLRNPATSGSEHFWETLDHWNKGQYEIPFTLEFMERISEAARNSGDLETRIQCVKFLEEPRIRGSLPLLTRWLSDPHPKVFRHVFWGLIFRMDPTTAFQEMPSLRTRVSRLIEEGIYDWRFLINACYPSFTIPFAQELLLQEAPNLRRAAVIFLGTQGWLKIDQFRSYASRFPLSAEPLDLQIAVAMDLNHLLTHHLIPRSELMDFWAHVLPWLDRSEEPDGIMMCLLKDLSPERLWIDPGIWQRFGVRARKLLNDPHRAKDGIDIIRGVPLYRPKDGIDFIRKMPLNRPEVYREILDALIGESVHSLADHRRGAAEVLGRIPDPRAQQALRSLFQDEDPTVRIQAIVNFPLGNEPDGFLQILSALGDRERPVQNIVVGRIISNSELFLKLLEEHPRVLPEEVFQNLRRALRRLTQEESWSRESEQAQRLLDQWEDREASHPHPFERVRVSLAEEDRPTEEEEHPIPPTKRLSRRRRED